MEAGRVEMEKVRWFIWRDLQVKGQGVVVVWMAGHGLSGECLQ